MSFLSPTAGLRQRSLFYGQLATLIGAGQYGGQGGRAAPLRYQACASPFHLKKPPFCSAVRPAITLMMPAAEAASSPAEIRVELRRGPVTMTVTWPASAAADFAAWTRELLR